MGLITLLSSIGIVASNEEDLPLDDLGVPTAS